MSRNFRLVSFEAKQGHYVARATMQMQTTWITEHMMHVFGNELTANQLLPTTIMTGFEDQPFDPSTSVVLQLLDASTTAIKLCDPGPLHAQRHLTRFEVVVWSSPIQPEAIDGPVKLKLDCGRRRRLYMVLDRPFEIGLTAMKPWNFMAMLMTRATFTDLFFESKELTNMIDYALCLGFRVEEGHSEQQVLENNKSIDIAYEKAIWVFDEMDQLDAVLSPVLSVEQVQAYMKRERYAEQPAIRDWKAEIGVKALSEYLEAE